MPFGRDVKTIGKHINNAKQEELRNLSVVANFATTAKDGKKHTVEYYNLDMIISIGYRVKSDKGILFRIWANKVLKEYLLKGHVIDHRFEQMETKINKLATKTDDLESLVKKALPSSEGIFYDGQIFDAYAFVIGIIKKAKSSIILIDNYIDASVLTMLSNHKQGVSIILYTCSMTKQLKLDIDKYNAQYPTIEVTEFSKSHDRFLIIDYKTVYHIGASLKDLGKKWFAFSKIELDDQEMLLRLRNV